MEKPEQSYQKTAAAVGRKHAEVWPGRMMSAPGIQYREKVFAFFKKGAMVFRLGKDYAIEKEGVEEYSLLNPFKNRPPMAAWFVVPHSEAHHWTRLAEAALERLQSELTAEERKAKARAKSAAAAAGKTATKSPAARSKKKAASSASQEGGKKAGKASSAKRPPGARGKGARKTASA